MIIDKTLARSCFSAPALLPVTLLSFLVISAPLSARTLIFQSEQNNSAPEASAPAEQTALPSARPVSAPVALPVQSSANSELFFMIEELQQQLKALRGVVEEQANEIRHLKRNAKARYLDLDSRVLALSKQAKSSGSSSTVSNTSSVVSPSLSVNGESEGTKASVVTDVAVEPKKASSAEAKQAYQEAYGLIKDKKFDEAVTSFYTFIEKYPDGPLTGNAYYWLGEIYLVLPQLEQARQAFSIVVQAYPGHSKVADSLFKLGVAYDRLQNPTESQRYLSEVQKQFPDSTAAKLAKSYKINR
ncbi:tol-pal system protein YbgF [Oleiphilus sp. HI0086]|uniref:tol-pal system protein YbgF n=2 Tax=unclassified Oleiphilus TaxID=2631174 RepID=UPI0007C3BE21|nr:tol-pal system protein YbgF [Oleiphilus sp. HI0086]KZZ35770.1 hypothetical protein A3756_14740 [Oleiphilus sp. HI0086]